MSSAEFAPGVLTGDAVSDLFAHAKASGFALPAANCIGTNTMNGVMETAAKVNAPAIIQFSNSGGAFVAGKGYGSGIEASVAGSISGALHVRNMAERYGARIILHTDHAAKKLLPWIDGMLDAGEAYHEANGIPLFSSHMLDLSEEPMEQNIDICVGYLQRMSRMDMTLEIELGITGGEEDGVDNSDVKARGSLLQARGGRLRLRAIVRGQRSLHDRCRLRQRPRRLQAGQREAHADDPRRLTGVHPGEVRHRRQAGQLRLPRRLRIERRTRSRRRSPTASIKMNIDTDLQWAFWDGIRHYESANHDYLQGQIGNPDGG